MKISLTDWQVAKKLEKIAGDKALGLFAAEEMGRGMNPYVPMETGVLSQSYTTAPFKVTYNAPYAEYQFRGNYNWSREMHPLATGRWDKAYTAAKGSELAKAIENYLEGM